MATKDWLIYFNNECEKLKSEIIDQGIQQMVQSREIGEFIDIFQVPINNLTEQVNHIEEHLVKLETEFSQLSANVSGAGGTSGTSIPKNPVDPETVEKLKALAKASKVNTRGAVIANIPTVGATPKPPPYFKGKKQ